MTTQREGVWPHHGPAVTGPLRGVRILDLTTVVMGPAATQMLGDLGADVIKIETPGGDSMRWIGPWRTPGMGPLFLQANRNKRSVVLDLKTPDGKRRALLLAQNADVLVSNVRPQGLSRLGLSYEDVKQANPSIIYCSAVGYGSAGPYSGQAVYDDLMQAASGIASLFGVVHGAPHYAPVNICDRVVGLYVANAVTAALYHRLSTGEGQQVEVPMFETMAQFVLADHMGGSAFTPPVGPMGYKRLMSRTRGPYRTKDGYVALVVYTDKHWRAFGQLVGQPDIIDHDPRFASQEARTLNAEAAGSYLADHLLERATSEWLQLLHGADIPVSAVNAIEDLFDDQHLKAVGFFEDIGHPTEGVLKSPRFPVQFSASPASVRRLAPNLGEHNGEVFAGDREGRSQEPAEIDEGAESDG
jgi:crotonobetainyl-CoA:carnitine CoA-transferase CaiB-like acyl-CoA transferase